MTRNNVMSPVATYIANIHGRAESLPVKSPWSRVSVNIGTASRCSLRHHAVPKRFRTHDDTSTITMPYIATMPNPTDIGRYWLFRGTNRAERPNGTNRSTNRKAMWIARNAKPALATVAWNAVDVGFEIRFLMSDVLDTRPHATERKNAT